MKKTYKFLSIILCIIMALQLPIMAYASQTTSSKFTSYTYTHQTKYDDYTITQGIDVSEHNGSINWNTLKSHGVDYAIIRVGYRGYGSSGSLNKDANYKTNIENAHKAGVKIGVYFYSQAITTKEAIAEANYTLDLIKSYKSYITLPVVFDYEFADVSSGRLDYAWHSGKINKTDMTNNALAFCETVENAGYKGMVYANKSFLTDQLDHSKIQSKYGIWLAHYTKSTNYSGDYQIWQYTDVGKVSGTNSTYVDCNFMYTPNSKLIVDDVANVAYTGKAITPEVKVYNTSNKLLTKNNDYTVSYKNNINYGTATINIKGINTYSELSLSKNFDIVPIKANTPTLVSRGNNSISIKWDKSYDINGYQVEYYKSGNWIVAGQTTNTSYTINNLNTGYNYIFRICSYKTIGSKKYYGIYSSTLKAGTIPVKVTNVKTSSVAITYMKLTWDKQSSVTYYNVYKYVDSTKKYYFVKKVEGGPNNYTTISGLKDNTSYKYAVEAVKESNDGKILTGAKSSVLTTKTKPKSTTLTSISTPSTKKITVKYTKVPCSGYQIMWSTTSKFTSNYKSIYTSSTSSSANISTYQSKAKYYVRIRPYNYVNGSKQYGYWNNTKYITVK